MTAKAQAGEKSNTRGINVLVVDDEQDICDYMSLILQQSGYQVTTQSSPDKVLSTLKSQDFHIVILDLMMPGMSGMEVLEQIRKHDDDIAVVVFTGHPSVDTAVQSLKYSVSDYLKKPCDIDELNESLEKILRKKGLLINPEEELHKTIGRQIRMFRKEQGLTLKQLSRRTGLSVSLLSQIERAESSASVSSLYKLATALDVRITKLFGDF